MSWEMMTVTHPVAQKDYHCEASDWIDKTKGWDEREYEEDDLPVIRKALSEGKKILKGTRYIKITGKWDGEFETFRAREDLDDICNKYGLYPEI